MILAVAFCVTSGPLAAANENLSLECALADQMLQCSIENKGTSTEESLTIHYKVLVAMRGKVIKGTRTTYPSGGLRPGDHISVSFMPTIDKPMDNLVLLSAQLADQ